MALTEDERERYGQIYHDAYWRTYQSDHDPQPYAAVGWLQRSLIEEGAAAVIAAYRADLAAQVRQWRESIEMDGVLSTEWCEGYEDGLTSVIRRLEGDDAGDR